MRRIAALIILFLLFIFAGCDKIENSRSSFDSLRSYQDVPGVTIEEIAAIEKLKKERGSFSYGHLLETESFKLPDGTYAGFTINVCAFFSDLFGVEFVPRPYDEWEYLKAGIDNRTLDFSGVFAPTAERMKIYHMTGPISGRTLRLYTLTSSAEFKSEYDVNGHKIGFLPGTVTAGLIRDQYPELSFEAVTVHGYVNAAAMLKIGEIDAFVVAGVADIEFEDNDFIRSKDFFPLAYNPISIATADPDLAPIISVINKFLVAGGIDKLAELYKEGEYEYIKYKLHQSFTAEERAYLEDLATRNAKVDIGLQHDVYPVSFYNEMSKEFEGIALDILAELSKLTGMEFEPITTSTDTPLSEILAKLKAGEISMMTQLLYTESRKGDYLWSNIPYHTTNYALLSRAEHPDLEIYQVYYEKVGTLNKSAHEEMFTKWFPGHANHLIYNTSNEAFDALEKGEIDLLMLSENMLLTQTNYREKPGFKINISFSATLESLFGFNKNEEILRSIVDKSLIYIDTDNISEKWLNRVFDYSKKIFQVQKGYLLVFSSVVLVVLIWISFLFLKNKRLSKEVLEQTAAISTIYKSIPDIVFSLDTNLLYTNCNPSFESFTGLPREKIMGKNDHEVFGVNKEMVEYFIEINQKVLDSRETIVVQEWVVYPDGGERFLETIKTPLFRDCKLTGLMGIARDITEHKAAEEEAREASKAKSLFLANMSHEIRTPMNAIIGMSELLLNESLTKRQQGYANDINFSSHSLLDIINDILDLSKIEAGKLELNPVDYDFQAFADNICSMFGFVAQKKGLEFKFETVREMPKCLSGDDIRLRQVLTNICGNAVKFTKTGFIRFKITAAEETLVFEIQDTGMGIREEELPKLFDPFVQVDAQKNRSIKGTGLGLPISKTFVEMMGGSIAVDSVYGEGTVFTITIPKVIGNEEVMKREDKEEKEETFFAPSAKILVVDDNEVNLRVASGLLKLYKIDAYTVLSGKEAVTLVQETDFDIVFMDHMMPEMDGVETTKEIRKLGGKYIELIIIALTANAVRGAKEMFMANGFDSFISKPIERDELARMLREWLPPEKIEMRTEPAFLRVSEEVKRDNSNDSSDNNKSNDCNDSNENDKGNEKQNVFLASVKEIKDINLEIGLSRVSGLEDMYSETVMLFTQSLLTVCEKLAEYMDNKDISNLAITSHSIKSSLATIGAMELSERAYKLETAAKEGDLDYCAEHISGFLEKLRFLYEQLSAIIPQEEDVAPRPAGSIEYLQENVQRALDAAADFDGDLALEALSKLLEYDFGEQTNALLKKAGDALRDFDFDAAALHLNGIS